MVMQRRSLILGFSLLLTLALWRARSPVVTQTTAMLLAHTRFLPLVVTPPNDAVPDGQASWSTSILTSPRDGMIWSANPDAGTVTIVDPTRVVKHAEIPVGGAPWALAIMPQGHLVMGIDTTGRRLFTIDPATSAVRTRATFAAEPSALALDPTGERVFVTLPDLHTVLVLDTQAFAVRATLPVDPFPESIVVSDDGDAEATDESIYVGHRFAVPTAAGDARGSTGQEGQISVIAAADPQIVRTVAITANSHGFPTMLAGMALAGDRLWVPHIRVTPQLPNGLTTTLFAAVSVIDTAAGHETPAEYLPLNDSQIFGSPVNDPIAAIPAPDGMTLYVVLAGSDLVEVIDIRDPRQPRLVAFLPTGANPRGMTLSQDGTRGYVMDYLGRSVTVLDLEHRRSRGAIPVTSETLDPAVLRGKILFNSAANPRMAGQSWISCASCHRNGGTDGVTWMFPDGPRQTPPLWLTSQTGPMHWSAALDELQDVEDTIETIQHGIGLAAGPDPFLLDTPNQGRSADLDALAQYIREGITPPLFTGAAPPAVLAEGRDVFLRQGCAACHGGPAWTSSVLPGPIGSLDPDGNGMVDEVLYDVGTLNSRDVRGATGFDIPTLINVGITPPYFHDGSQATLEDVVRSGHPTPQAGETPLTAAEIQAIAMFLRSLTLATPTFTHGAN